MVDDLEAVEAFAALAQSSRLAVFRTLVEAGPAGLAAGDLARTVGLSPSALSFHLAHLSRAALIDSQRDGRRVVYAAAFVKMNALVAYLTENCCGGQPCDVSPQRERAAA